MQLKQKWEEYLLLLMNQKFIFVYSFSSNETRNLHDLVLISSWMSLNISVFQLGILILV